MAGHDMTPACVCGHAAFLHNDGCMRWFLGCGCTEYQPDNGTREYDGTIHARPGSDPYLGRYGRKYTA